MNNGLKKQFTWLENGFFDMLMDFQLALLILSNAKGMHTHA